MAPARNTTTSTNSRSNALRKLATNENIPAATTSHSKKQENFLTASLSSIMPSSRRATARNRTNMQDANSDASKANIIQTRAKRKRDVSPGNETNKRSALGNLTNKAKLLSVGDVKDEIPKLQKVCKKEFPGSLANNALKHTQSSHAGQHTSHAKAQAHQEVPKITTRAAAAGRSTHNASISSKHDKIALDKELIATVQTKKEMGLTLLPPPAPMVAANAHASLAVKKDTKSVRRISNEFNKTEESLYMSALEDISSSDTGRFSDNFEAVKRRSQILQQQKLEEAKVKAEADVKEEEAPVTDKDPMLIEMEIRVKRDAYVPPYRSPPNNVDDFDKANWDDPFQVSHYAMEIFEYMKGREPDFPIDDYMKRQVHLSIWMRSLLVDWMVEVQETFELNHETLYLAVKIVDLYLSRLVIHKDKLQLLGAAALFIACKYDERIPPSIEDFLYICDGAYKHDELIKMEQHTFRTIGYELGIPLSYRFLRRYARCARIPMTTLTLARYILELSLMDYATVGLSDSRLAAAALFMALRMHGHKIAWIPTLEYYSGYTLAEFAEFVPVLNANLRRKPKNTIKTIRTKYSHKIFHEVSKVPGMSNEKLFENNLDASFSFDTSTLTKTPVLGKSASEQHPKKT